MIGWEHISKESIAEAAHTLSSLHSACLPEKAWSVEAITALFDIDFTQALLLQEDGQAVGFSIFRSLVEECEILSFGILPEYQGKGLGKALLDETINRCGASKLFLEMAEDNMAALALYTGAGFTESGRRKDYYRTDEGAKDAIVMEYRA